MRLVCPNCDSNYEVDGSLFPEEGREVQCSNCEHKWVQYPEEEAPTMVLDPLAAVAAAPRPQKPSERLPAGERETLRRQAQQEVSFHEDTGQSYGMSDFDVEFEISEEDIRAALREQVKVEGGDFEKEIKKKKDKDVDKSQKRNLRKAAEAAGIEVDKEVVRDRWQSLKDASEGKLRDKADARTGRPNRLTEALKHYEESSRPRGGRGRAGRAGFALGLVAAAAALVVYLMPERITDIYPPAAPWLDQYTQTVNQTRDQVESLYAEYSVVVMAKIDEFTAGDETPAE